MMVLHSVTRKSNGSRLLITGLENDWRRYLNLFLKKLTVKFARRNFHSGLQPIFDAHSEFRVENFLAENSDFFPRPLRVVDGRHRVSVVAPEKARLADFETLVGGKIDLKNEK